MLIPTCDKHTSKETFALKTKTMNVYMYICYMYIKYVMRDEKDRFWLG
jgi:hypothetical protein